MTCTSGNSLLIYICNFHVLSNLLLIYICKLHWDSVEEMFALVSSVPHVITDRYHPGVASMIVGTDLSLTMYRSEATKMNGLRGMLRYSRAEIVKMNQIAFTKLKNIIKNSMVIFFSLLRPRKMSQFNPKFQPKLF